MTPVYPLYLIMAELLAFLGGSRPRSWHRLGGSQSPAVGSVVTIPVILRPEAESRWAGSPVPSAAAARSRPS